MEAVTDSSLPDEMISRHAERVRFVAEFPHQDRSVFAPVALGPCG
jgi:hypothetical protein